MKYPAPLKQGSTIAVTAFSAGIAEQHQARFQVVTDYLRSKGMKVVIGDCLYGQHKHVSAPARQRADELMTFLLDDSVDAIYPPWGGEIAMELLPLLDFERLQNVRPKWLLGFSDISTLSAVFTSKLGWATAHSSNLMDLTPKASDGLTENTIDHMATETGQAFGQNAPSMYASRWPNMVNKPLEAINPDRDTCWKWLVKPESGHAIEGRLIGGCWDTLHHLFATEYLDIHGLSKRYPEGIVLYLENAEMPPPELARAILNMKFRGVFNHLNGLLLGRNAAQDPDNPNALIYHEVLQNYLSDLGIPVMMDLDIGHKPPNLTLINGAMAKIELHQTGTIEQWLV